MNMRRSFDEVLRSTINKSKSKQTHAFSHSRRFIDNQTSACLRASYNLSPTMMGSQIKHKARCTSQSPRIFSINSVSPGPCAYTQKSFVNLLHKPKIGSTFDQSIRIVQGKSNIPGPGAYSPKLKKKNQLSYTMSPRLDHPLSKSQLGPGKYQIEKYNTIQGANSNRIYSKYTKVQSFKMGQEERFHSPSKSNNPAPNQYKANIDLKKPTYAFGRQERSTFNHSKLATPGPGAYHEFSQFAQRRRQLEHNLRKMENLVHEK